MANSGVNTPFTKTFFGDTPDDPPFFIGDRMVIHEFKSLNYVAGSAGWRISNEGDVEFNDATFRGTLESDNFVAGTSGWRLLNTGEAEFSEVTVRGNSELVGATITGTLTMSGSGMIRTAASGTRTEMSSSGGNRLDFFTGDNDETLQPSVSSAADDPNGRQFLHLSSGERSGGGEAYVRIQSTPGDPFDSEVLVAAERVFLDSNSEPVLIRTQGLFTTDTALQLNSGTGAARFVVLANGQTEATSAVIGHAGSNGAAYHGQHTSTFSMWGNYSQVSSSVHNYAIAQGGTGSGDGNTYVNCLSGNAVVLRVGNSYSTLTVAESPASTTDMRATIPALGGGNTMNIQAGGSWQMGYIVSSRRFKENIRDLDTAGDTNPLWKLRATRFNWNDRVLNRDESQARFPDGVAGLIAEEVSEVMPDAVTWAADDDEPTGLDHERLLAYLVDAVQHVNARLGRVEKFPALATYLKGKP